MAQSRWIVGRRIRIMSIITDSMTPIVVFVAKTIAMIMTITATVSYCGWTSPVVITRWVSIMDISVISPTVSTDWITVVPVAAELPTIGVIAITGVVMFSMTAMLRTYMRSMIQFVFL